MSFLDKLKAIGIHFEKLKEIKFLNFSLRIDNSVHIEGSSLTINPEKLSGKQRRGLQKIIKADLLEASGAILDNTNTATIDEAIAALPAIEKSASKFELAIPQTDLRLLRACLFLRDKYRKGEPIDELKREIVSVYGPRGRNLANLCSAGYIEGWFEPLLDGLIDSYPDTIVAHQRFQQIYKLVVTDLPWTEFVSSSVSSETCTKKIAAKMKRNLETGVRHLSVHGLGKKNVAKIRAMLPQLSSAHGIVATQLESDTDRIYVRLE